MPLSVNRYDIVKGTVYRHLRQCRHVVSDMSHPGNWNLGLGEPVIHVEDVVRVRGTEDRVDGNDSSTVPLVFVCALDEVQIVWK